MIRSIKIEAARLGMKMPTFLKKYVNITKKYADNIKALRK